jgi:hypothetical protein
MRVNEADKSEPDAWYLLKFIQRVLESPSPTEQDRLTALGMTQELRSWAWICGYKLSMSPLPKKLSEALEKYPPPPAPPQGDEP